MNNKKVIAVIPARSGSRGVPNKNIRFLNGRPLVSYAIETALKSKFIDHVIVSTDSPEVQIIAKQLGAEVKIRNAELCGDAVALDAVVYDAIEPFQCDMVVTLQPTSPNLSVFTLDAAIAWAYKNELDTLISVVNSPHLAWVKDNEGKVVQAYAKRLNRQYLPPYYKETGAFVISKRSVVTKQSRIGENIDVFEIPEDQSIDIDSYDDLLLAEYHLSTPRIAFYVNGNNGRGVGHIYRVLELADAFFTKVDIYYDINQTDRSIFGNTMHNLIGLDGLYSLFTTVRQKHYTLFINDILDTSIDYMIALKKSLPKCAKIVNFEDGGEGANKADLVFNALFEYGDAPHVMAGDKYFIPSKLFMYYKPIEIKEQVKKCFISFGGADPSNYTDTILEIISKEKYLDYSFEVVLGRAKKNVEALLSYNSHSNINVYQDVSNMPEIMSLCDIGITSRGRTGYELAILGIPSIAMAQNKREEKHGFVSAENGFNYLGLHPSAWLIENAVDSYLKMPIAERRRLQDMLLSHDLRNGRKRVIGMIKGMC